MGSASVYTTNPGLVISQVVVETNTWVNDMLGNSSVEYIELFNPTTSPINIGVTGNPNIRIDYDCEAAGQDRAHGAFNFVFISTYVPSGSYYLLASATAFMINGSMINADACFGSAAGCDTIPTFPDHLDNNRAGAIRLSNYLDNASYDTVGWNDNNNDACVDPGFCEGTSIPNNTANGFDGMQAGNQIVRFSSACAVGITYGRAYDTDNNANDFYYNNTAASGIVYRPFNSSSPAQTVISGRPSTGAYVLANDGNSAGALSCEYSVTGPQGQVCAMSSFTVVGVATGTWTVAVMTENSSQTISNVVVSQGLLTTIPNGSTSPSWPDSGFYNTVLSSAYMGGFAGGMVFGVGPDYFKRINGILMCASDGSPPSRTDSQGFYVLNLTTGITVITANCNSDNGSYTSDNAVATIAEGAVTTIPAFHLAQGGVIKGYVTPGLGALPNIPVLATLGTAVYEDTTDNTGYFYIFAATAAAAYTITPILDPLQSYTSLPGQPLTSSVTVPGDTVFAGTVTVIGALGTITGSVSANGSPITTGVLVVASTGTVPDPMPAITAATSPSLTIFYAVSSKSDGMYSLEVRASTTSTYNVRFFYPVVDIKTGIAASPTPSKLITGISVGAGAATPDQNFTWP
ncbi:MAG: hypothetical protein A2021_07685 [Elusimicrobia bacterium GWF2_52_66]|nr:MAG: hypothetical protein A2021_07685 [Elusimicrobia bacterium GWF2_52_66]